MSRLYEACHRALQDRRGSRRLADLTELAIFHDVFTEDDRAFVEGADMFFLSSVSPEGQPTVSYKGGLPGFVRVRRNRLSFPVYDGNGMFLSAGNAAATARVGLLFIDFETPRRLRIHGVATLDESEAGTAQAGALFSVQVVPTQIFVNCPRYIHRRRRIESSKYAPGGGAEPPLPAWKQLEGIQAGLTPAERAQVQRLGTISPQEYEDRVWRGEG